MLRVILIDCSESKSVIEGKISNFISDFKVVEIQTVHELIQRKMDFDLLFVNKCFKFGEVMDYTKRQLDEKLRAWIGVENPISEASLAYIDQFFPQFFGFQSAILKLEFFTDQGVRNLPIRDIQYFEFIDRKVKIQSKDSTYFTNDTLKNIWDLVASHGFYHVHKSVILNLEYVRQVKNYLITMENGEELPLSQKKSREFRLALQK